MAALRREGGIAALAVMLGAGMPLAAQVTPPAGTLAAPPTREEIERAPPAQPAPPARLTVTGGIERGSCPLVDPRFAAVTVSLTGVVYNGLGGVDGEPLRAAASGYLGRSVPVAAICDIRDEASAILRREGYLAAVQVPPQRIAGGVLHLDVVFARLVAIHVRGNAGHAERLIAAYLEGLKDGRPFNQKAAERRLLLAGDLPGYQIRLSLSPAGTGPGEVVGDVIVTRVPFTGTANIQNLGSHAVGRWSGLVNLEADDLLGLGDRATLGFFNTADIHEQSVLQGSYELRPGSSGMTVGGAVTYAWTRPDLGSGNPLRARTLVATADASFPLVRKEAETLRLTGGLDHIDQRLRFGGRPFTTDRLRVLYARADYVLLDAGSLGDARGFTAIEPHWRVSGSLEARQGIGALGASNDCGPAPYTRCLAPPSISRLDADPRATLVRFGATFEYRPRTTLTLAISPRAQYAFDPLLNYEQFSAGNYTIGRGYDPGALIGDSGYGFQAEARLFRLTPSGPKKVALQPFGFFDAAWVRDRGPLAADDTRHLYSVGGGVRAALGNVARLEVTLAGPLTRTPLEQHRPGARLLVNLVTRFL